MLKRNIKSKRLRMMSVMGAAPLIMIVVAVMLGLSNGSKPASAYASSDGQSDGSGNSTMSNSASNKLINGAAKPASSTLTTKVTPPANNVATSAKPISAAAQPAASINKSKGLYAWSSSNVATQANAWAATNPGDAAKMHRLANTPMAVWFTGDSNDPANASNYVGAATAAGQIPVLVAYNIPQRDCGSYSAGGVNSVAAYQSWVNSMAGAIGQRQAIVIVEPDSIAGMDCLSSADQQARLQLINYSVQTFRAKTAAAIYLDAGNSNWQSAQLMASRLQSAGIAQATGFSLNVSNFQTSASNTNYGNSLSSLIGGKHFVIDTSRNGNGPTSDNAWCNPDGRAFGSTPTLATGSNLLDGYLWIKAPGESDGSCGAAQAGVSAPPAGAWWPQYVLMLAANSGW